MRIILASQSPRRRALLAGLDIDFEVRTKDTPEDFPADMPAEEVPKYLAHKKAQAFAHELAADELLITADTVVILEGEVINKPADATEAIQMLTRLAGKRHTVITGVCVLQAGVYEVFSVATEVFFNPMQASEIAYYVAQYKPLDKAGAYGIQDWWGYTAVSRIEGDFYNVMGLPIGAVYRALKNREII